MARKLPFLPFNFMGGKKCPAMNKVWTLILVLLTGTLLANDTRLTRSEYIDMWKDVAIENMVNHRIPASITLAQGILESGDGNSELARKSNNHFGIKCHSDWTGKRVYHDDDAKGECFRKYNDARQSFEDHSMFLKKNRYAGLFELEITDYKGWARGLKKAGYATNPKYADRLIGLIEANKLTQYDEMALAMMGSGEATATATGKKNNSDRARARRDKNDRLPDIQLSNQRSVSVSDNRIKFILGKEGDTIEQLAEELGMMRWQIRKYNDFSRSHRIRSGERIYLQPKRARAKQAQHVMLEGESIWDVSQTYGVKIKKIYQRNDLEPGSNPPAGTRLRLR